MACSGVAILSKLNLCEGLGLPWGMQQLRDHGGDPVTDWRGRLGVCTDQVPAGKDLGSVKHF